MTTTPTYAERCIAARDELLASGALNAAQVHAIERFASQIVKTTQSPTDAQGKREHRALEALVSAIAGRKVRLTDDQAAALLPW